MLSVDSVSMYNICFDSNIVAIKITFIQMLNSLLLGCLIIEKNSPSIGISANIRSLSQLQKLDNPLNSAFNFL
jgi:hypothetical protein